MLGKTQNRRQSRRIELSHTVVLNPEGACEVIEMGSGGFSFKCLYEHSLLDEWSVDILNNSGVYLQAYQVEKVWELADEPGDNDKSLLGLAVGVRFKDLSPEQQATLDHLLLLNDNQLQADS